MRVATTLIVCSLMFLSGCATVQSKVEVVALPSAEALAVCQRLTDLTTGDVAEILRNRKADAEIHEKCIKNHDELIRFVKKDKHIGDK